jgi:glucose/arabinose dehydrogenase
LAVSLWFYWVPVIAPGNLMFYTSNKTFPQWNGNGFISGLGTTSLNRSSFDGHGGAKSAERWNVASASTMWKKAPMARCGCRKTPTPAP